MNIRHEFLTIVGLLAVLALPCTVRAQDVPASFTYQGLVTDSTGQPLPDGSHAMRFRLYGAETGGTVLWDSGAMNIGVRGGLFAVALGASPTPPITPSVLAIGDVWLEVQVGMEDPLPRVKLHSAPFAIRARTADTVADNSVTSAKIADGSIQLADIGANGASANQVIKRNASNTAWTVAPDSDTTYVAGTGLSLSGTTFSLSTSYLGDHYWTTGGNAATDPAVDYIGTSDNSAFELRANNSRALRIEPTASTPNLIGGYSSNAARQGVIGAVIGGGGNPDDGGSRKFNSVTDYFGTVGGGVGNTAGNNDATLDNAKHATVAGGQYNEATASLATVGGGWYNRATYERSTVAGGWNNLASNHASVVGGGRDNIASGSISTVPGGAGNRAQGDYSFAAGRRAKADHPGTFVWGDSTDADFVSTGNNQFLIRASGGVGIGTSAPDARLHVVGGAGKAVYGKAANAIGVIGYGVYGESGWADGIGTYGTNVTNSTYGYLGSSDRGAYGRHGSGNAGSLGGSDYGVKAEGDLVVTGAYRGSIGPNGGAPFPRPAYDSGWVAMQPGMGQWFQHNIGGDIANYVIDMQFRKWTSQGYVIHNVGLGHNFYDTTHQDYDGWGSGAHYRSLESQRVYVERGFNDVNCEQVRLRIWVYK